jgi:hypothetical protein
MAGQEVLDSLEIERPKTVNMALGTTLNWGAAISRSIHEAQSGFMNFGKTSAQRTGAKCRPLTAQELPAEFRLTAPQF